MKIALPKITPRGIHNICMLAGWSMVTAGAWQFSTAAGLIVGGVLLIALTLQTTRALRASQG